MCAICQVEFEEGQYGFVFKGCNHPFHVRCMSDWLERGDHCPCCRKKLKVNDALQSRVGSSGSAHPDPSSARRDSAARSGSSGAGGGGSTDQYRSSRLGPALRAYYEEGGDAEAAETAAAEEAIAEEVGDELARKSVAELHALLAEYGVRHDESGDQAEMVQKLLANNAFRNRCCQEHMEAVALRMRVLELRDTLDECGVYHAHLVDQRDLASLAASQDAFRRKYHRTRPDPLDTVAHQPAEAGPRVPSSGSLTLRPAGMSREASQAAWSQELQRESSAMEGQLVAATMANEPLTVATKEAVSVVRASVSVAAVAGASMRSE